MIFQLWTHNIQNKYNVKYMMCKSGKQSHQLFLKKYEIKYGTFQNMEHKR